jgi:cell division protein FtsB
MKRKKPLLLLLALVLCAFAGFFFFGREGIYYQYRNERRKTAEIKNDRRVLDSLQRVVKPLSTDSAYVEHLARENLGMAHDNEKVYQFIDKRK